jgi:hypothetical protein
MKRARKIKDNADIEKILQCYIHRNGKSHCEGCDLTEECEKFKEYIKKKSKHPIVPVTHTSAIMKGI